MTASSKIPPTGDQFVYPTQMPNRESEYEPHFSTIPGMRIYPFALLHFASSLAPMADEFDPDSILDDAERIANAYCKRIDKHNRNGGQYDRQ